MTEGGQLRSAIAKWCSGRWLSPAQPDYVILWLSGFRQDAHCPQVDQIGH
jgi:hypothetical protein